MIVITLSRYYNLKCNISKNSINKDYLSRGKRKSFSILGNLNVTLCSSWFFFKYFNIAP